jgi:hypothetical protein
LLGFCKTTQLAPEGFVHREDWADWKRCSDVDELREAAYELPALPVTAPIPAQSRAAVSGTTIEPEVHAPPAVNAAGLEAAMGHDPFADSEGQADEDDEVTRHGQIPRPGFDGVHSKSWDLDHVPALAALSASGLGVAPRVAHAAGDRSGVIDMASLLQASARPVQDPTMRSVGQPGISRAQLHQVRPSVLTGLALFGLLLGTGTILAWSAVRGSGKTAPELQARAHAAVADAARLASASPAAAQAAPEPVAAKVAVAAPTGAAVQQAAVQRKEAAPPEMVIDEATANAHETTTARAKAKAARISRWQAKRAARLAAKAQRASRRSASHSAEDVFASTPKHAAPKSEEEAAPVPAVRSKPPTKDESLDDLVEGAISAKHRPAKSEAAPKESEPELPATPSRDQMLTALSQAKTLVAKCKGSGTATVSINVKGPSGRASKVSVEGVEGSSRSCVESAIRKTAFPKFQQENFAVKAPFKLQET